MGVVLKFYKVLSAFPSFHLRPAQSETTARPGYSTLNLDHAKVCLQTAAGKKADNSFSVTLRAL